MARIDPERVDDWIQELNSPLTGRDPDRVTADVIEDEMSLFMTATSVLH